MHPKPQHLRPEYRDRFQQQSMVDHYHLRLRYPPETFEILAKLAAEPPRRVLDVGTGTGDIARPLCAYVEAVDAVDISPAMVARGQELPGGDHSHLNWVIGPAETVSLHPPYGLVVGGDSLHWLDWELAFPRFRSLLKPEGMVAIVRRRDLDAPWHADLMTLIRRYSTMPDYEPYDLIEEITRREVFRPVGEQVTRAVDVTQSVDDYVASFHSRAGFALETMTASEVADFSEALRSLVTSHSHHQQLSLQLQVHIAWGRPLAGGHP